MPEPDFVIRGSDTISVIQETLTDDDGNPVDLTGALVHFQMAPLQGGTGTLVGVATIDQTGSPPNFTNKGVVHYTWAAGNTTIPGWYAGEWQVEFSGGGVQTYPNGGYINILITPQVA